MFFEKEEDLKNAVKKPTKEKREKIIPRKKTKASNHGTIYRYIDSTANSTSMFSDYYSISWSTSTSTTGR